MCEDCVATIEVVRQRIATSLAVLSTIRPDRETLWRRFVAQHRGEPVVYGLVRCSDGVLRAEPDAQRFERAVLDKMDREREWLETRERRNGDIR